MPDPNERPSAPTALSFDMSASAVGVPPVGNMIFGTAADWKGTQRPLPPLAGEKDAIDRASGKDQGVVAATRLERVT